MRFKLVKVDNFSRFTNGWIMEIRETCTSHDNQVFF
jgi:hypothetical protein